MAVARSEVAGALRELIAALDRRARRVDRADEASIAREAASLREQAVKQLAELADSRSRPTPSGHLS